MSSSAIGYYGARGEEPIDEDAPPGRDFLAEVCAEWEAEALRATELGARVVTVRTGVVLDRAGGALAKMLPPFRLGLGGPGGGRAPVHLVDPRRRSRRADARRARRRGVARAGQRDGAAASDEREFSRALGRALRRPALLPVPGLALRLLYGEMAQIVTTGARVVPAKPLVLGYEFAPPRPRRGAALARSQRTSSGARAPARSAAVRPPPAPARRAGARGSRSR